MDELFYLPHRVVTYVFAIDIVCLNLNVRLFHKVINFLTFVSKFSQ